MKAYELHADQGDGPKALKLVERAAPELGPTDVKVRVRAVSLNFRDLAIARDAKRLKKPIVPVSDGAGEVTAVGSSATTFKVGDRVAGAFSPNWVEGPPEETKLRALGGQFDGMLAEEVVLPAHGVVRLPDWMSFAQAATLPCAAVTAWQALFVATALPPGATMLVQGSGGVSVFALQLARAAHVNVIATSSSAEKRARLEKMGAFATLDYKATPAWGKAARALANGGRGVDLAIEVGGAGTFDQSVQSLRLGGTLSLIGTLTGMAGPVDTYKLLQRCLTVKGIVVGSVKMFEDLLAAMTASKIEPVIDRTFTFDKAQDAYEYLAKGEHFGKVVIEI